MKTVKDLLDILKDLPEETPLAIQKNWGGGDFSIHQITVMPHGHIGFSGCLLHMGEQYKHAEAITPPVKP